MKYSYAKYIVSKTEDDYNRMSSLFSNKRSYLTPDILEYKKYLKKGDRVLDFGCGNGRVSEIVPIGVKYVGIDLSSDMIEIAKIKYPDKKFHKIKSFSKLEFDDESFDVILCLAVLHHIPSQKLRIELLQDLKRTLKPGGKLIATVWDLRQKNDVRKLIFRLNILRLFGLNKLDHGDIYYPFKDTDQNVLADRYIHCFTKTELKELFIKDGFSFVEIGANTRGNKIKNKNISVVASK